MSAITFLAIGALLIIAMLCLFFWLTEGGGSVDKMRDSLIPIATKISKATVYFRSAWAEASAAKQKGQASDPIPSPIAISQVIRKTAPPPPPKGKRLNAPSPVELPPLTGVIRGTRGFDFHVVGESHYQPALRKIRNSTDMKYDNEHQAFIVTEPDNPYDRNACAVYIQGMKVGFLPREAAAEFVRQMRQAYGVTGVMNLECKAKLIGGYGDKKHLGVMLNLPTGD